MKWLLSILFAAAAAALNGCLAAAINVESPQDLLVPFNDLLPPWDVDVEATTIRAPLQIASTTSRTTTTTTTTTSTTTRAPPIVIPVLSLEPLLPPVEDVQPITTIATERPTTTTRTIITTTTPAPTTRAPFPFVIPIQSPFPALLQRTSAFEAVAASINYAQAAAAAPQLKAEEIKPTKKSYYQQQQKQQKQQQQQQYFQKQFAQYQQYQPPTYVTRPPKGALPTITPFPRRLVRLAV